jgi:hypothetical protein
VLQTLCSEPSNDKRGAEVDELHLTPLELIDRIAALLLPPRPLRHRYSGVLSPNSPLRCAVTAMAQNASAAPTQSTVAQAGSPSTGAGEIWALPKGNAPPTQAEPAEPPDCVHHPQRRYPANAGSHRGGVQSPAYIPSTRATAVGGL